MRDITEAIAKGNKTNFHEQNKMELQDLEKFVKIVKKEDSITQTDMSGRQIEELKEKLEKTQEELNQLNMEHEKQIAQNVIQKFGNKSPLSPKLKRTRSRSRSVMQAVPPKIKLPNLVADDLAIPDSPFRKVTPRTARKKKSKKKLVSKEVQVKQRTEDIAIQTNVSNDARIQETFDSHIDIIQRFEVEKKQFEDELFENKKKLEILEEGVNDYKYEIDELNSSIDNYKTKYTKEIKSHSKSKEKIKHLQGIIQSQMEEMAMLHEEPTPPQTVHKESQQHEPIKTDTVMQKMQLILNMDEEDNTPMTETSPSKKKTTFKKTQRIHKKDSMVYNSNAHLSPAGQKGMLKLEKEQQRLNDYIERDHLNESLLHELTRPQKIYIYKSKIARTTQEIGDLKSKLYGARNRILSFQREKSTLVKDRRGAQLDNELFKSYQERIRVLMDRIRSNKNIVDKLETKIENQDHHLKTWTAKLTALNNTSYFSLDRSPLRGTYDEELTVQLPFKEYNVGWDATTSKKRRLKPLRNSFNLEHQSMSIAPLESIFEK
eukprot:CAMPEP_0117423730 /NCGR_PEP_ID=MMETSP0758-20121206/4288_1 /TAXON_ID=63605 /ORGANISM="Percolomonas cosmopolitus, Strain AE-1 (ATCC 50343)" /LENGTH=544 /DNA_ID=CAMNT_0005207079 /DNA_START=866 /DNA_END=2500 /DNA_ORIENTATION=-